MEIFEAGVDKDDSEDILKNRKIGGHGDIFEKYNS